MSQQRTIWLSVLMAALLGLYGCNQETASNDSEKSAEPATTEQAQDSTGSSAEQAASDTAEQVEEAAEQVAEAAQEVVEQASEAASNAAEQAGEAVNQAVEQVENAAAEAVETAQTQSEESASQSSDISQSTSVAADHPEAFLSPADKLQADTVEAARHDRTQSKIPYIGAWAASAQGCALIDQGVYDGFAVITPNLIRMFEEGCAITAGPMQSNPVVLDASCQAEGETNQSRIIIEILKGPFIKLAHEGTNGFDLVRCNLPE